MSQGFVFTPRIRVIFFDLVGTLIHPRRGIGEQYAAWARRFGAAGADAALLGSAFDRAMHERQPPVLPAAPPAGLADAERAWWHALVRQVVDDAGIGDSLRGDVYEEFFAGLYEHFATAEAWERYPDVGPTLGRLRAAGIGLGLLTNYDTRVHRLLGALGLDVLLDSVTIPALAGAAKPDRAIFLHALAAHAAAPDQAIHVGDDPGDDYRGAENAGMTAVLLDRDDRCAARAARRIRSLTELRP